MKDENKILNLIKIGPFFVILFSIIITYVMIENNNQNFEDEIERVKEDSLHIKKELIKNEINKVLSLIKNEKQLTIVASFEIALTDFEIDVPELMFMKINEIIKIECTIFTKEID